MEQCPPANGGKPPGGATSTSDVAVEVTLAYGATSEPAGVLSAAGEATNKKTEPGVDANDSGDRNAGTEMESTGGRQEEENCRIASEGFPAQGAVIAPSTGDTKECEGDKIGERITEIESTGKCVASDANAEKTPSAEHDVTHSEKDAPPVDGPPGEAPVENGLITTGGGLLSPASRVEEGKVHPVDSTTAVSSEKANEDDAVEDMLDISKQGTQAHDVLESSAEGNDKRSPVDVEGIDEPMNALRHVKPESHKVIVESESEKEIGAVINISDKSKAMETIDLKDAKPKDDEIKGTEALDSKDAKSQDDKTRGSEVTDSKVAKPQDGREDAMMQSSLPPDPHVEKEEPETNGAVATVSKTELDEAATVAEQDGDGEVAAESKKGKTAPKNAVKDGNAGKAASPTPLQQKQTRSRADDETTNGSRPTKEKSEKDGSKHAGGSTIETRLGAASSSSQNRPSTHDRDSGGTSEPTGSRGGQPYSADVAPYSSRHHSADNVGAFVSGSSSKEPSFLESMGEEERRTRTRHVPSVEGFRRLHKSEIKRDLKAAKSLFAGVVDDDEAADDLAAASAPDSESLTGMEVSDDNVSDVSRGGNLGPFVTPDQSVVGSITGESSDVDREASGLKKSAGAEASSSGQGRGLSIRYPHIVESVTAFTPPRPPESCAPKKKHRLLRWERNPHEVEVDINNYKRTVERTRKEVHITEQERERVESVGATLRSHFLHQLKALREESIAVNKEVNLSQMKCAKEAELMATRTRSKGSNSMRDVLSVLRTRGEKLQAAGGWARTNDYSSAAASGAPSGIGGTCIGDESMTGADIVTSGGAQVAGSRVLKQLATGWVLPGDRVLTAYGAGVVENVFGASGLDPKTTPVTETAHSVHGCTPVKVKKAATNKEADKAAAVGKAASNNRHDKKKAPEAVRLSGPMKKKSSPHSQVEGIQDTGKGSTLNRRHGTSPSSSPDLLIIPARVCVRLAYGLAYVPPHEVRLIIDPSTYSDAKIASRWKAMVSTAISVGGCPDSIPMNNMIVNDGYVSPLGDAYPLDGYLGWCQTSQGTSQMSASSSQADEEESVTAVEDSVSQEDSNDYASERGKDINERYESAVNKSNKIAASGLPPLEGGRDGRFSNGSSTRGEHRVIPFGGGMLPTPGNRGDPLSKLPLRSLQASLDSVLFTGAGILGKPGNPSVPADIKEWEEQRQALYETKAKVLTLRNQLYRQRRARIMNERGYASAHERAERVEILLNEMKADLKSLKMRLKEELGELGIDQQKARDILAAHLKEQKESDKGHEFRLRKRQKKGLGEGLSEVTVLRTSRRKAEEAAKTNEGREDGLSLGKGNDDLNASNDYSGDDPVPRRKRGRGEENSVEGATGNKSKRSQHRRQRE